MATATTNNWYNWYEQSAERHRENFTYCGGPLYAQVWGEYITEPVVVTIFLCLLLMVCLTNFLNIMVFSRSNMRSSPTNMILLGISVCDLGLAFGALIWASVRLDSLVGRRGVSEYFIAASWILMNVSMAFLFIGISLTVLLAVWRYIAVIYPLKAKSICTMKRTKLAIGGLASFNLMVTAFRNSKWRIVPIEEDNRGDGNSMGNSTRDYTIFHCGHHTCLATSEVSVLDLVFDFYDYILLKGGSAVLLSFITIRLILELRRQGTERRKMRRAAVSLETNASESGSSISTPSSSMTMASDGGSSSSDQNEVAGKVTGQNTRSGQVETDQTTRVTKMLIMILILFLIEEFSSTIIFLTAFGLGEKFVDECFFVGYLVFSVVYGVTNNLNFVVYLSMNRQFKQHVLNVGKPAVLCKKMAR